MRAKNTLMFVIAMLIWGSLGVFVTNVNLPSQAIVMWRTIIGTATIGVAMLFLHKKLDFKAIKKNLLLLVLLGVCMAGSWVCLFEAYRYTSVGTSTLMYYSAPIMVFAVAPIFFKEKMTLPKVIGMATAVVGMLIINSATQGGLNDAKGVFFALLSAITYALIMIFSKFVKDLSGIETSFFQIMFAGIAMIAYNAVTTGFAVCVPQKEDIIFVLVLGIIHSGIAIYLYFTSLKSISAQSAAILSYVDPASALFFSAIFLNESITFMKILGAILILGGTLFASRRTKKEVLHEIAQKEDDVHESEK